MAVLAESRPLIKEWLRDFLRRHRARYAPNDWPVPGSEDWQEYVRLWFGAFIHERVDEHEAEQASLRLAENPPQWQRDHIPRVMAEIRAIREAGRPADAASDRDVVARESRNCPHCDGNGMATVERGKARTAAHCTCSLGRWMRGKTDAEMRRRIPDLADVVAGRSEWRLWRLTEG